MFLNRNHRTQAGKVYVKVFWLWSILISIFLTLAINLIIMLF